jgi:hypothetical protein
MKYFFFITACCIQLVVFSQVTRVGASYSYIYSGQWDKAIQTYNFSRPFLTEPQRLLIHGTGVSGTYFFPSSGKLQHGIHLAYSYFRSSAENTNLTTTLHLHLLSPGYVMHLENAKNTLYAEAHFSLLTSGLFRQVNNEPISDDDTPLKALGIGGSVEVELGYHRWLRIKNSIDPFITVGYSPYLFSRNSEAVLNQTSGLTGRNWTGLLQLKIGIQFTFETL